MGEEKPTNESDGARNLAVLLAGHLGHLTAQEEQGLSTLKENLGKAGLCAPSDEKSEPPHDDSTLLRFLRARKFDPVAAQKQYAEHIAWRKEHNVEEIFRNTTAEDLRASSRYYPQWTGRRDKLGHPLFVYRLAALDNIQQEWNALSAETRFNRVIAGNESMTRFLFPLLSHLPHSSSPTPISSSMSIIDLEGASFSLMWKLRTILGEASKLSTANYPETIHGMAVVNAPSYFPTIWTWLKGWFDEGTRLKIHVLGNDPGGTLRDLIDPHDLPAVYGGELPWTYGDEPDLDEDTKSLIGELPKGPAVFVNGTITEPPSPTLSSVD
ncbi:CRAL-TRIO domain-containing protein [Crassisporium funariophilum]|nr:CRAL-TRIO domain-containing protein [Crassisporium funariophilum]